MGKSLVEYASCWEIIQVLVKERAKARKANRKRNQKGVDDATEYNMDKEAFNAHYSAFRRILGRMMPPRRFWVHPSYRSHSKNSAMRSQQKLSFFYDEILNTIKRDVDSLHLYLLPDFEWNWTSDDTWKELSSESALCLKPRYHYLHHLACFCLQTQELLKSGTITFSKPKLTPIFKKKELLADGESYKFVFRPLSVYNSLQDKIIISVTCRYLTKILDRWLHSNLLSYRAPRRNEQGKMSVPSYHDGARMIKDFRSQHKNGSIYVADCDIQTFYDTINHNVVRKCFEEILNKAQVNAPEQVMAALDAYLNSYSFYKNVMEKSAKKTYWDDTRNKWGMNPNDICQYKWVSDDDFTEVYGSVEAVRSAYDSIGVPQGGALSLVIANVVLNHVDSAFIGEINGVKNFFCRYCDDMILMSTDENDCKNLIEKYKSSLKESKLLIHKSCSVFPDYKRGDRTRPGFWNIKSHDVHLWGAGAGNASSWVGFLGYEFCRTGGMRLRRSTIDKQKDRLKRQYSSTLRRIRKYVDPDVPQSKWDQFKDRLQTSFLKTDGITDRLHIYTELDPKPEGKRSFQIWQENYLTRYHSYNARRLLKWIERHQAKAETDVERTRLGELFSIL